MSKNTIQRDGDKIKLELDVLVYKEDKYYLAFCPALNLSSFGETQKQSLESFSEALDLFIEDIIEKNTVDKVLKSLGWQVSTTPKRIYKPPYPDLPAIFSRKPLNVTRTAVCV